VPTKGLSLPLISAGGSGLIITCGALGLLYSVCRRQPEEQIEAVATEAQSSDIGVKRLRPAA
jgi:cell division protein FtsW (lipid II flippase)